MIKPKAAHAATNEDEYLRYLNINRRYIGQYIGGMKTHIDVVDNLFKRFGWNPTAVEKVVHEYIEEMKRRLTKHGDSCFVPCLGMFTVLDNYAGMWAGVDFDFDMASWPLVMDECPDWNRAEEINEMERQHEKALDSEERGGKA